MTKMIKTLTSPSCQYFWYFPTVFVMLCGEGKIENECCFQLCECFLCFLSTLTLFGFGKSHQHFCFFNYFKRRGKKYIDIPPSFFIFFRILGKKSHLVIFYPSVIVYPHTKMIPLSNEIRSSHFLVYSLFFFIPRYHRFNSFSSILSSNEFKNKTKTIPFTIYFHLACLFCVFFEEVLFQVRLFFHFHFVCCFVLFCNIVFENANIK